MSTSGKVPLIIEFIFVALRAVEIRVEISGIRTEGSGIGVESS